MTGILTNCLPLAYMYPNCHKSNSFRLTCGSSLKAIDCFTGPNICQYSALYSSPSIFKWLLGCNAYNLIPANCMKNRNIKSCQICVFFYCGEKMKRYYSSMFLKLLYTGTLLEKWHKRSPWITFAVRKIIMEVSKGNYYHFPNSKLASTLPAPLPQKLHQLLLLALHRYIKKGPTIRDEEQSMLIICTLYSFSKIFH